MQPLDAALDLRFDPARAQLLVHDLADLVDEGRGLLAPVLDLLRERVVAGLVDVAEGQVLELVFDLGHPEPAGDRRVDVERLARDPLLALLRQVLQRAHVVEAVGELDQDHPDVVDHRQQHLAVGLRLALLAGRERDLRDLGDAFHDVQHVVAEVLAQPLGRRQRVLEHVVQQADRDADRVHPHLGQDQGDLERVDEVGLTRGAQLPLVLDRRKDVSLAEDLEIGVRVVPFDRLLDVLEANHGLAWSLGIGAKRVK